MKNVNEFMRKRLLLPSEKTVTSLSGATLWRCFCGKESEAIEPASNHPKSKTSCGFMSEQAMIVASPKENQKRKNRSRGLRISSIFEFILFFAFHVLILLSDSRNSHWRCCSYWGCHVSFLAFIGSRQPKKIVQSDSRA